MEPSLEQRLEALEEKVDAIADLLDELVDLASDQKRILEGKIAKLHSGLREINSIKP